MTAFLIFAVLLGLCGACYFAAERVKTMEEPGVCRLCGNFGSGDKDKPCPDCGRTGV